MNENYLEIFLNGVQLSTGGGVGVDVISLSLVSGKDDDYFWLQMSGRKGGVNVDWLQRKIEFGSELSLMPCKDIVNFGQANRQFSKPPIPKYTNPTKQKTLIVSIENKRPQIANIADEEFLQLVVTWTISENKWKLEVDSLSMKANGFTTGKNWLNSQLELNKQVIIFFPTLVPT